jgi:hypothetical protein
MHFSSSPLGLIAVDLTGDVAGRIEATYPYDGSTAEFAVVHLARGGFGQSRLVPLAGALRYDDTLQFPYTFDEMEAAPSPDRDRWGVAQADSARAYW